MTTAYGNDLHNALDHALAEVAAVAILRAEPSAVLVRAARTLAEEGFTAVEFPLTGAGTYEVIAAAREAVPSTTLIGAGTVLTVDQARRALDAGAQLLVTPAFSADVVALGIDAGVPVLPGVLTATEVMSARACGARLVKLFPADAVGPGYLRALREPLPDVRAVPTGGVTLDNAGEWFAAGAVALGLGRPLTADTLDTGDLAVLRQRARAWLGVVTQPRPPLRQRKTQKKGSPCTKDSADGDSES